MKGIQIKLTKLAEDVKQMMSSSFTMLVKTINQSSTVAHSDSIGSCMDPQTVQGVANSQRVNELEASQRGDK